VYQLKRDFPALVVVANGGVTQTQQAQQHLARVDGVMIGRAAYDSPWFLTEWDAIIQQAADSLAASSTCALLSSPSTTTSSTAAAAAAATSPPHHALPTKDSIEDAMVAYMVQQMSLAPPPFHWKSIARHMLGLRNGQVPAHSLSYHRVKL
jgi:tRNA-dihydrouridine synthase